MQAVVRVSRVRATYDRTRALDEVSFDAPPATITGIIGPNGAGKSTLLKSMLGLMPHIEGHVTFFGEPLDRVRERVAYMPQSVTVDPSFPVTVFDVVLMGTYPRLGWIRRPKRRDRDRALEALVTVGLSHLQTRPIGALSGGQRQRVFLARALAQDPDLLVMDEPFQGVDAASEATIIEVLRGLRDSGLTVIMVHHDLATVPEYCDRVVLLNQTLIAAGPTETTFTSAALETLYGIPAGGKGGAE